MPGVMLEASKHWLSQQKKGFNITGHTTGFTMNSARSSAFTRAQLSVKVAANASLAVSGSETVTIKALELPAAGGGMIDGFAFAEDGTLDVTGLAPGGGSSVTIPVAFANATGLGNMSGWTLTLDGVPTRRKSFTVSPSGITVNPVGSMFILR